MESPKVPPISIENAKILFRNFSGKEGKFNAKGLRNFCVLLEDDLAQKLIKDGWNVRWLEPNAKYEERRAYLQVKVRFDKFPPRIMLIKSKGKSRLDEENVHILDWAEFETVNLIISGYSWDVSGKTGIKAYLKRMYATLVEDEFEKLYENVPDSAQSALLDQDDDEELPFDL